VVALLVYRRQLWPDSISAKIRELYDLKIKPNQERDITIKAIYLYPVRGVKGIEIDHCEVTPYGLKFDRNWVIVRTSKMKPLANNNSHLITYLRQEFIQSKHHGQRKVVRLYLQDDKCFNHIKKREQIIDYGAEYDDSRFVEAAKGLNGYKESDEVCKWLTDILGEEVILLRAN